MKGANLPSRGCESAVGGQVVDATAPWSACRLGDVIGVKHGYAFKGQFFSDSGSHKVLTPGNFIDEGGFKSRGEKDRWYTGAIPQSYVLKRGDLIVAMTEQAEGLLGSAALVPESDLYLHNQRLGLVEELCANTVERRFLYYLFNSTPVRKQIRATANGAKVRHTSPGRICSVEVLLPPVHVQHKIASILSAYDDLIENNLRRIKILEEMAQSLYKEWFVDFRFPGHEKVKMVDSPLGMIPEGWKTPSVGEELQVLGGGTPDTQVEAYYAEGSINWYTPSDLTASASVFVDASSRRITEEALKSSSAKLFPPYSVMMTSRATIGVVAINTTEAATNQGFIVCLPNERVPVSYLYHWFKGTRELFENLASGATFKELRRSTFREIPILVPSAEVMADFASVCQPVMDLLLALQRKNTVLRQTRDLLLPKLISGEIDVSDLDIDVGEDAA